ncbi:MAG: SufS family cysteine desulfurase [Akkermansia sp.]|nr:SufS family cysteine desulfurase [Akkermansia sp.]
MPCPAAEDFPILATKVGKHPLVYLDNAATTQKPVQVLEAERRYYTQQNSNIHRGAHYLSRLATEEHEAARSTVAEFLHAGSPGEIIFTSGCTAGINLVAQVLALSGMVRAGDEILVSTDSHHSNIVPWQMLCERTGAVLRPIPLTPELQFDMAAYEGMLSASSRIVSVPYISNALGAVNPVPQIIAAARRNNPDTLILVDGAQSTAHLPVNVQELGCDFYTFSGHKVYAPTGTGALWGRKSLLEQLPPWQGGGEMISEVTFARTTYNTLPFKYEAGTPNIAGNIVLAEALRYVQQIGLREIDAHESELTRLLYDGLESLGGIRILGPKEPRGALISITVPGVHHYDLGTLLDQMGVAVRTGHHCCQPFMQSLGITGTTRYSFALYNTKEDVYRAISCTERALNMLR